MYLEIFQADFAVLRVFLGISLDFAEIPEIRGSVTARNIRSPAIDIHSPQQHKLAGWVHKTNLIPRL